MHYAYRARQGQRKNGERNKIHKTKQYVNDVDCCNVVYAERCQRIRDFLTMRYINLLLLTYLLIY